MATLEVIRRRLGSAVARAAPGRPAADDLCSACVGLFAVDGAAVSVVHEGASRGTFGSSDEVSRRLDEYQFTYGEGPCLDAAATREVVLAPYLDSGREQRWPAFVGAAVGDGVGGIFAVPVMVASVCVGALDLFRERPGPLGVVELAGARFAAELASVTLVDTILGGGGARPVADLDRVEVYRATGVLIAQLDVGPDEALARLRAHAVAVGLTASQVAFDILAGTLVLDRDLRTRPWRDEP